ncbi:hypothetical protein NQ016_12715, partial [Staphylococcus hyicus]|nr:hypothetical protein [Staphylococcus hyicus]
GRLPIQECLGREGLGLQKIYECGVERVSHYLGGAAQKLAAQLQCDVPLGFITKCQSIARIPMQNSDEIIDVADGVALGLLRQHCWSITNLLQSHHFYLIRLPMNSSLLLGPVTR